MLTAYLSSRCTQVLELAAFVRSNGRDSVATVLAGDLNSAPDTLEFALVKVRRR